jgi:ribosomal protein S18 acetylase RimI-like enzyme
VTVRDARPHDLGSIRQFLQTYVDEFWNRPFPRPDFSPDYLATGKIIVADEGGEVIGMAKAIVERGCGHVSFVYVAPHKRRRGIARALLRVLCDWFMTQGVVNVTLGVDRSNPAALVFWERLGFREFHRQLATSLATFNERL